MPSLNESELRAECERAIRSKPTQLSYSKARKRLADLGGRPIKLAILSSVTVQPIQSFLDVEARLLGFTPELFVGPYNQFETVVLDDTGELYAFEPDVIVLWPHWREWMPDLCDDPQAIARRVVQLCEGLRARAPAAKILVTTFTSPATWAHGTAAPHLEQSAYRTIAAVNHALCTLGLDHVALVPLDEAQRRVGIGDWEDRRMWYTARLELSAAGLAATARWMARTVKAATTAPRKVLALDLDETLWGGIVGEDGPEGIHIGESYPGNVFQDIQRRAQEYRDRGILLAMVSKNDEALVREVFETHDGLVLKWEDFSAHRVNWQDKASNLRSIAEELSLGLDSFVFVDDDDANIALVRAEVPEVETIHVTGNPLDKLRCFEEIPWFDALRITGEDTRRPELYAARAAAEKLKSTSTSLDGYYASLEMALGVVEATAAQVPRIGQLTRKTNQFNLTTVRCSDAEITQRVASPTDRVYAVTLKDRFTDHGIIGVAAMHADTPATWRVDLLLLSCRILGREVERAVLARLVADAREAGATHLQAHYAPTPRNGQTEPFFPRNGFEETARTEDRVEFTLDLSAQTVEPPSWFS